MVRSAASRALSRVGRDVTIRNYEQVGTNRPDWDLTAGSPYTVPARVDYAGSPTEMLDEYSAGVDVDVSFYIEEGKAGGVSEIRDGGGSGASEIDVDGETFVVQLKDVQDNGLIRLSAVRES